MATTRAYVMQARAKAAEATRLRILQAAHDLFRSRSYDQLTLQDIADRAGVTLRTVLRKFGSKDALLLAVAQWAGPRESQQREVMPGDVRGVTRVLAERYEALGDVTLRYTALEDSIAAIGETIQRARLDHWRWLERAFAPCLPAQPASLRKRRVAQLFAATEIYVWHSWRRRLGLSRRQAEDAMRELLELLIAGWGVTKSTER